jgi:hypothetical protein
MKRFIIPLFACLALLWCCSNKEKPDTPTDTKFVSKSYNGDFVVALSNAYDEFVSTDELPATVNVQGIKYSKVDYVSASCLILAKMQENSNTWQDVDVEIPRLSFSINDKWDTYDPDSISIADVEWMAKTMYDYATSHSGYPNYCTFPTKYVESDGTEHDDQMTPNNAAVILARVFHEYVKTSKLPDKVSSWQSDFLRKESGCETDSPVVLAAMKEAIGTAASTRAKAEALFNYTRDKWEWVDYPNTVKGSVKTIQDKSGNCCDLSHGLIAMTRAAGIPARYMHGQCQFSSSIIGHVFVEMYVDGKWYICDPSNNSNTFGTHNWKHMATFNGRYKALPF